MFAITFVEFCSKSLDKVVSGFNSVEEARAYLARPENFRVKNTCNWPWVLADKWKLQIDTSGEVWDQNFDDMVAIIISLQLRT